MVSETKEDNRNNNAKTSNDSNKNNKNDVNVIAEIKEEVKKPQPAQYVDKPTREKIAKEVEMVKVGVDAGGNWLFRRSDRLTEDDKKSRLILVESIKRGMSKRDISNKLIQEGIRF